MIKMLAGAAGLAAFAAATPAAAQVYGYSPYGYGTYNPYGYANAYGYNGYTPYGVNSNAALQQCTAAVQNRLYNRNTLGTILGSLVGIPINQGRVVGITSATQTSRGTLRVRGLASSGRYATNTYNPYAYGALGYGTSQAADLSFTCDVDYRGYVRDVDIDRRY
jgi:hypothetical protein